MNGNVKCDSIFQLTSCLDALVPMNDICLSKSILEWETITGGGTSIANLFGENPAEEDSDKPIFYYLNQIVYSDKRAKNQLLTSIIYQALRPVYMEVDGSGEYSTDPLDLPHIEILFFDNSGDFCFETLKDMIFEDLLQTFKENKEVQKIEILEFAYTILDKVSVQPSFTLKEFMFNLKKGSIHMKRNPATRLVVVDSVNTFFINEFSKASSMLNSTDPPKRSARNQFAQLEYFVAKELARISQAFKVKVVFTSMEYFCKKAIKCEAGSLFLEEQIYKHMSYQSNEQFDIGISVLYLVNPAYHFEACKLFLNNIGIEGDFPNGEPEYLVTINKRNNKPDYLLRAIRIDKGAMSLTVTKKAEIKGVFGRGYFSDDQEDFLKRG